MNKQPKKIKHWAEEAYGALDIAWGLLKEEFPNPDVKEKLELIKFAPAIAGMNRGIKNKNEMEHAYYFVFERVEEDLKNKEKDEPYHYSILFLIAYIDSHISFGILTEKRGDEIMGYLSEHYEINYEP